MRMLVVTCPKHGRLGRYYDRPGHPIDGDKDQAGKIVGKSAQRERAERLAAPHEPCGIVISEEIES